MIITFIAFITLLRLDHKKVTRTVEKVFRASAFFEIAIYLFLVFSVLAN